MIVEAAIDCGNIDIYIRMILLDAFDTLGAAYEVDQLYGLIAAAFLEESDGSGSTAAGCQHGVTTRRSRS